MFMHVGGFGGLLVYLVIAALWIVPLWRIMTRTGHHGAWSLIAVIPVLALVLVWVLAFKRWPVEDSPGRG